MYIIEGSIGAGKSTLVDILATSLAGVNAIQEPVNKWDSSSCGDSLLSDFYNDPRRWAFAMETYTLACRLSDRMNLRLSSSHVNILERSVYSGYYCFAKNGYESGFLTKMEWQIYTEFFNFFVSRLPEPKGFIYVRTKPDVALSRIKKRSRDSENSISLDYLEAIHNKHEDFLIGKKEILRSLSNVPVLVLDGDLDFEKDPTVVSRFVSEVATFISLTDNSLAGQKEFSKSQKLQLFY